jgi:hypothetical protein
VGGWEIVSKYWRASEEVMPKGSGGCSVLKYWSANHRVSSISWRLRETTPAAARQLADPVRREWVFIGGEFTRGKVHSKAEEGARPVAGPGPFATLVVLTAGEDQGWRW